MTEGIPNTVCYRSKTPPGWWCDRQCQHDGQCVLRRLRVLSRLWDRYRWGLPW